MLTSISTISFGDDHGSGREGMQGGVPAENVTSEIASDLLPRHDDKITPNVHETSTERKVERGNFSRGHENPGVARLSSCA